MSHTRETYKIAVVETSVIVRTGVIAALKRALDSNMQFFELDSIEAFQANMKVYSPDIVIVNPFMGGFFDVGQYRAEKPLADAKFIAIVSSLCDENLLAGYDGRISIYSTEPQIHNLLDALMGNTPDDDTENSEEDVLSQREKEIVCEVVKGLTNKEIADRMNLSVFTVLTHRRNISKKLQIHSSTALTIYAITNNLVSIDEVK
ncbi:MAG: response regulator transcription factor [Bacteroidales bacterium]|nr:response regulator transcription factor [Bacteroidales bacterium]